MNTKEIGFENRIEKELLELNNYEKYENKGYDSILALDKNILISYVKETQPNAWKKHENNYGTSAEDNFIKRFDKAVSIKGILKVLREGFDDRGTKFKVIEFKPNSNRNDELIKRYNLNKFHISRQLHYSPTNKNLSLDMVIFVNGIPLVTLELKNEYSGQTYSNAINQYKYDRNANEPIFKFKNRTLVHFALDTEQVYMTTRLENESTYFLPFNQGSNGAGVVGTVGNPINQDNYDTSYLWLDVLSKDRLLEIISKYMHLQEKFNDDGTLQKEVMIFPRYHQLDVVTKILGNVNEVGAGKNYLIQHSAGSGKSNSIAWLSYRLASIQRDDKRVFDSVIVITDRKVLDRQLQDTIYQFDHVNGMVECIGKNKTSKHLLEAINNGKDIIISTIQKFPVIYRDIVATKKNFAIIVDEAHSSQTGSDAKKLKEGLANIEEHLEEFAREQELAEEELSKADDKILNEIMAHGQHNNLSFFAFTATPKNKTLQLFGDEMSDGTFRPFHIYSMKQAIDEGFILDVLENYMTYECYYKINKTSKDDPELTTSKGVKAVLKYETLHPTNISQKAAVILDHFNRITKDKINGKGKAMIVTASRLHAVKYLIEIKKQIEEKDLKELEVLIAFSGEVTDPLTKETHTEEGMNLRKDGSKIKESQLPKEFEKNFNMLIVAEKYQTGFDEPLLHTMFVDKKLSDVKAVQTLSRLNRTCRGKVDTFVLDFVNKTEDIKKAFQSYYECTVLNSETNPNTVYDIKYQLDEMGVYTQMDVEKFGENYYSGQEIDAAKFSNFIKPTVDRFSEQTKENQATFKSGLQSFLRVYSFITNAERMFDIELQKFYVFAKFLSMKLPRDKEVVHVDDKLVLEYYKLEQKFLGKIELEETEGGANPIEGGVYSKEVKKDKLSTIIDAVNTKFGTNFTEQDKILSQLVNDMIDNNELSNFGKNNNLETFKYMYQEKFEDMILDRSEQNQVFFKMLANNDEFRNDIMNNLLPLVFERIKRKK